MFRCCIYSNITVNGNASMSAAVACVKLFFFLVASKAIMSYIIALPIKFKFQSIAAFPVFLNRIPAPLVRGSVVLVLVLGRVLVLVLGFVLVLVLGFVLVLVLVLGIGAPPLRDRRVTFLDPFAILLNYH